jgi:hypothetical protein
MRDWLRSLPRVTFYARFSRCVSPSDDISCAKGEYLTERIVAELPWQLEHAQDYIGSFCSFSLCSSIWNF